MTKHDTMTAIGTRKLVGIIRCDDQGTAYDTAQACIAGGIQCLEIALTTPGGLDVIQELGRNPDIIIGAGTVLDRETARLAILAGAKFLLSPSVDCEVIEMCNQYQVVSVPGAFSATEVVTALRAGASIVKIFPSNSLGPDYLRSIAAPLPQALLMPSGGVGLENISRWLDSGAFALGVGGCLTAAARIGQYQAVTAAARQFVDAVEAHRTAKQTLI